MRELLLFHFLFTFRFSPLSVPLQPNNLPSRTVGSQIRTYGSRGPAHPAPLVWTILCPIGEGEAEKRNGNTNYHGDTREQLIAGRLQFLCNDIHMVKWILIVL